MHQVAELRIQDILALDAALGRAAHDADSVEDVAQRMVRHLYLNLLDGGDLACPLVRFYKTIPYGELLPELQLYVRKRAAGPPAPSLKCLTLLATAGQRPEWNDRWLSRDHQAIALGSEADIARLPMVGELIRQLGISPDAVMAADPRLIVDEEKRTYNVFHVEEAPGSPFVPAQEEFVRPLGIRSVLGFGAMLGSGELSAIILFSRVPISRDLARQCKLLALSVRRALLNLGSSPTFSRRSAAAVPWDDEEDTMDGEETMHRGRLTTGRE